MPGTENEPPDDTDNLPSWFASASETEGAITAGATVYLERLQLKDLANAVTDSVQTGPAGKVI